MVIRLFSRYGRHFWGSFPVLYDEYADSYVEVRIKVRVYYEEVSKSSVDDVPRHIWQLTLANRCFLSFSSRVCDSISVVYSF